MQIRNLFLTSLFLCTALSGCTPDTKGTPPVQADALSKTEVTDELDRLDLSLDAFLNDGDSLPTTTETEYAITWTVVSGDATIEEGILHKNESAQEKEPISLEASVTTTDGTLTRTFDHLLLLDEYVGWIMTYFSTEGEDQEQLKLAYTYDGAYWYKLNKDSSVLAATLGTKRLRDPSMIRKKDGSFALLATQGYDNPSIYIFDTEDMITYTNERLVQVNASSEAQPMNEKQAWAPEGFYDRTRDTYIVYWSSPSDGPMFFNSSSDLTTFCYPQVLFDPGYPIIDGTIFRMGNTLCMIFKNETQPMEEYSNLFLATSSSDYLSFESPQGPITGHQSEGPFVLQRAYDYLMYYDDYTRQQFLVKAFYEPDSASFMELGTEGYLMPIENPSHANAIPVTWKEMERIYNQYGE